MRGTTFILAILVLGGCAELLGIDAVPDIGAANQPPAGDGGPGSEAQGDVSVNPLDEGSTDSGAPSDATCPYSGTGTPGAGVLCSETRCERLQGCCDAGTCDTRCSHYWSCESAQQCAEGSSSGAPTSDCCATFALDPTPQCPRKPVEGATLESACQARGACPGMLLCRPDEGDTCPSGMTCEKVNVVSAQINGYVGMCVKTGA